MTPFSIIIAKENSKWKNNWMTRIFEKFSMMKLLYENNMNNFTYLVKQLVVGIAHQCQRCITKDYSIPGGKEYRATWWMRERMYLVYNITKCDKRMGIIINNKRYSTRDRNVLFSLIKIFKNKINLTYIDWRKYSEFEDQLKILSCACIYISGPGTGLLNFPFISDPGIIINLGGTYRGCPIFMEQYIEEGSPHFVSLYYPSKKRIYGIHLAELIKLIKKSIYILNNWNYYKNNQISNLSVEGELFKALYYSYPKIMKKVLNDTDFAKEGHGIWAERFIYFPHCYSLSYIKEGIFNISYEYMNRLGCNISRSHKICD